MRNYGQRACNRCGRLHPPRSCFFPLAELEALHAFRRENGRNWRAKLRELWNQGKDEGELRYIRNTLGPRGIDRLARAIKRWGEPSFPEPVKEGP